MTNEQKEWILANMRYDADTGVLERRLKSGRWKVCSGRAGCNGYAVAKVLGEPQLAHRVAWLLARGGIDDNLIIDHVNGNKTDNRLCNIRLGTTRENQQNRVEHREGKLCGCYWDKQKEKWRAQIIIDGKRKHLGYFATELEAHEAYLAALPSQP